MVDWIHEFHGTVHEAWCDECGKFIARWDGSKTCNSGRKKANVPKYSQHKIDIHLATHA